MRIVGEYTCFSRREYGVTQLVNVSDGAEEVETYLKP